MRPLPSRPRLADHVMARRHFVGDRSSVVLHDPRTGRAVALGAREWELLACADGTRDLDGILVAAAREGAHANADHLRAFLAQLSDAGFVDDGDAASSIAVETRADDDRALDVLSDFSLHCDGRGSCCRQYETVLFAPVETARARASCPDVLDAGTNAARAFLPEHGANPGAGSAVALVDGACAYFDAAIGCRIHAAGGAAAKPLGCQLFPATFVDDGVRVRVSAAVECACVLASVGRRGGEPLALVTARTRRHLAPEVDVVSLPSLVRVTEDQTVPREALHAWSSEIARAPAPRDAVTALLVLADDVETRGLAPFDATTPIPANRANVHDAVLRAHLAALHSRLEKRVRADAVWRSERDISHQSITWMARACMAVFGGAFSAARVPPDDPAREHFYVRASLFGHALALDGVPIAAALRDRAARLVLARALAASSAEPNAPKDPALREPIAVVEAMLRGHGISAYVYDLERP